MIESVYLKNFTVFDEMEMKLSPGINVIIGENGTGKSHLLKAIYAMSSEYPNSSPHEPVNPDEVRNWMTNKFVQVFKPLERKLGKLRKDGVTESAYVRISYPNNREFDVHFHANTKTIQIPKEKEGVPIYSNQQEMPNPVFIPAKEILSIMLGLRSIIQKYETSFDETYENLINLLELPNRKSDSISEKVKWSINTMKDKLGGEFVFMGGGFVKFKATDNSEYSVNVMAEGFRKLGTLHRLLETGGVSPGNGAPLLWDEPDANLNPLLIKLLVQILFELTREGQQIIIATHYFNLVKWIDILNDKSLGDHVTYHLLTRNELGQVEVNSTENYAELENNPINDAFSDITKGQAQKMLNELKK